MSHQFDLGPTDLVAKRMNEGYGVAFGPHLTTEIGVRGIAGLDVGVNHAV